MKQEQTIDDIALEVFQPPEFTLYVRQKGSCGYVDRMKDNKFSGPIKWEFPGIYSFEFHETKGDVQGHLRFEEPDRCSLHLDIHKHKQVKPAYLVMEFLRAEKGFSYPVFQKKEPTVEINDRMHVVVRQPAQEGFIELRKVARYLQVAVTKYNTEFKAFEKVYTDALPEFLKNWKVK